MTLEFLILTRSLKMTFEKRTGEKKEKKWQFFKKGTVKIIFSPFIAILGKMKCKTQIRN